MPTLYALGQHKALVEIQRHLRQDESIFAYLDDIYVLCEPDRVYDLFLVVRKTLETYAGVKTNLGKTKIWNAAGIPPPNVHEIDAHAWVGADAGIVVLGTPIGSRRYTEQWIHEKNGGT